MSQYFGHFIILGYKSFQETTQKCIESIGKFSFEPSLKFTVIDNGSSDHSPILQEQFLRKFPNIDSCLLPENTGFAGGMNYGAQLHDSSWIILLGSDIEFSDTSFEIFLNAMQTAPENVGIICPVTNEAGTAQKILSGQWASSDQAFSTFYKTHSTLSGQLIPLYRADFFCVAIRRIVWDQLNGLSLAYGRGYYEDFDFSLKAKFKGFSICMVEDAFVFHQGSGSFKASIDQKKLIKENKKIFLSNFPGVKLPHRREDNLAILEHYSKLQDSEFCLPGIQELIKIRVNLLEKDVPRSFWKKRIWKLKTSFIKSYLNNRLEKIKM